jgi:hypothetical protein
VEIDTNMPAGRVARVLDWGAEVGGDYPEILRMDNGPEFSGGCFDGLSQIAWREPEVHSAQETNSNFLN